MLGRLWRIALVVEDLEIAILAVGERKLYGQVSHLKVQEKYRSFILASVFRDTAPSLRV